MCSPATASARCSTLSCHSLHTSRWDLVNPQLCTDVATLSEGQAVLPILSRARLRTGANVPHLQAGLDLAESASVASTESVFLLVIVT